MRARLLALSLLVLISLPCGAAAGQAVDPAVATAIAYMDALYAFDFDGLGDHLAADAIFSDPTATAVAGEALHYQGREAIVASFRAGAAATRNAGYEIERQFSSGEHVVLTLTYHTEIDGELAGLPGEWIPVRVPAVTILRVVDGRISEHVDYVDYDTLLAQMATFPR